MKPSQLKALGVPHEATPVAVKIISTAAAEGKIDRKAIKPAIAATCADPEDHRDDPVFGELANAILEAKAANAYIPRGEAAPSKFMEPAWKNRRFSKSATLPSCRSRRAAR